MFIGDINYFKKLKKKIFVTNKISRKNFKKKIFFYNINSNGLSNYKYINTLTDTAINLLRKKIAKALINMPIDKKKYLKNKHNGFTELFAKKLNQEKKESMLLYNEHFSVLPITTHIKISNVASAVTKKKLKNAIFNVNNFYQKIIKKKINIKILGLNPHAGIDFESRTTEKNVILPLLKSLKYKVKNISGPYSADTVLLNYKKEKNFNIIGMYHDQVLPVFKTLFNFNGVNITIGLKYLRLSPDHGTGKKFLYEKNGKINNKSFLYCLKFCEKYI